MAEERLLRALQAEINQEVEIAGLVTETIAAAGREDADKLHRLAMTLNLAHDVRLAVHKGQVNSLRYMAEYLRREMSGRTG